MATIRDTEIPDLVLARLDGRDRYRAIRAEIVDHELDVHLRVDGDERNFGIRLPLPSSDGIEVWLYVAPNDAQDWTGMLGIWMDEEILTGATSWAALTLLDDVHYFTVELYGFRSADESEHERLTAQMKTYPGGFGWTYYGG